MFLRTDACRHRYQHFGSPAVAHGKGSRPSRKYLAAQDVLEGTASISRFKTMASLASVSDIRELLGFLCGKPCRCYLAVPTMLG